MNKSERMAVRIRKVADLLGNATGAEEVSVVTRDGKTIEICLLCLAWELERIADDEYLDYEEVPGESN